MLVTVPSCLRMTDLQYEGKQKLNDVISLALDAPGAFGITGIRLRVVGAEKFTLGLYKHAATL